MTQDYKYQYQTYPIQSEEMSHEGALKRFSAFPTPKDVYDYALLGLPKYFPLTREPITEKMVEPFLNSAITEIEMELGCNISPVVHFHAEDYLDGQFTNNYSGIRLQRWPATEIIKVSLKYPHSLTQSPYQTYTIPPGWIMLRRNRMNVVASVGSVSVQAGGPDAVLTTGGIFAYISGFARGNYAPGTTEVVYKAGFEHDKLPSSVSDLIKTWAAHRFLADIVPVMFPQSSVSVGIDGVQQSVGFNMLAALQGRLTTMEQKKKELAASLVKSFGRTMKMGFIGA